MQCFERDGPGLTIGEPIDSLLHLIGSAFDQRKRSAYDGKRLVATAESRQQVGLIAIQVADNFAAGPLRRLCQCGMLGLCRLVPFGERRQRIDDRASIEPQPDSRRAFAIAHNCVDVFRKLGLCSRIVGGRELEDLQRGIFGKPIARFKP